MYRTLFNLLLRRLDPEQAHHLALAAMRVLPVTGLGRLVQLFTSPRSDLSVRALGLTFPTPFGMAAGFDKDARVVTALGQLGFGHVEVGTLTAIEQPGNDKPRLARLIADRAIVNRMGFNNAGSAVALPRLAKLHAQKRRPIIGANIGKSRVVAVEDATSDYVTSARRLAPHVDYLVVNVSSPNTPGLRGLQDREHLAPLLRAVKEACGPTPLLVKIAPDLSDDEVCEICELVVELHLDGIVATNTTLSREHLRSAASAIDAAGAGGLSGRPVAARSLAVLRVIRSVVPADLCVISVGGVETADQVAERLEAGATLVQGYTGFIYRGPLWARQITRGLERLRREGWAQG